MEMIQPPIINQTIVEDKRDKKQYVVVMGMMDVNNNWSFSCWPIDSDNQEDCIIIGYEHLNRVSPKND